MHPFSSRAFQRHQEHDLKHPGGSMDLITTKQNKLPFFMDRLVEGASQVQPFSFWSQFDWPIAKQS